MSEMNVRSDSVDVEQIMRQIRARIREKRGADYTEAELQQLATVKLEKFLDPRGLRSDLVAEYRRTRVVPTAYGATVSCPRTSPPGFTALWMFTYTWPPMSDWMKSSHDRMP